MGVFSSLGHVGAFLCLMVHKVSVFLRLMVRTFPLLRVYYFAYIGRPNTFLVAKSVLFLSDGPSRQEYYLAREQTGGGSARRISFCVVFEVGSNHQAQDSVRVFMLPDANVFGEPSRTPQQG